MRFVSPNVKIRNDFCRKVNQRYRWTAFIQETSSLPAEVELPLPGLLVFVSLQISDELPFALFGNVPLVIPLLLKVLLDMPA